MAWIKYFDASPAFFMAVNGQMAFPNTAAAQESTRKFAQTIRHIELKWGDDLRVDPSIRSPTSSPWSRSHGARFTSIPPGTALPKLDTLPDLQSIARDAGGSATLTGRHPFPPSSL
jgi:hypothetical protein